MPRSPVNRLDPYNQAGVPRYNLNQPDPYNQAGGPRPTHNLPDPFKNAFSGAGAGLIRGGLGAYGEKILDTSTEYVTSNISQYFSDPQYYFQVNGHYVRNKLKVILFPFLHRGHWTRITEPVGGRLSYKPPVYDINAPDLYIPLMAFGTYLVLAGLAQGLVGKFSPEAMSHQFTKAVSGWFIQMIVMRIVVWNSEAPLLDIVAYTGYTFTGISLSIFGRIMSSYSYYLLMPFTSLSMGVFLVKTIKRIMLEEVNKQHILLLFVAAGQFPYSFWLGSLVG
ncbi:hypothetical protein ACHQM5_018401 [Ranunculus cassubicifolius]